MPRSCCWLPWLLPADISATIDVKRRGCGTGITTCRSYVYSAAHLRETGPYRFDARAATAYYNRSEEVGYQTRVKDLAFPFHKDPAILSSIEPEPRWFDNINNDPGLVFLFFLAFTLFGDDAPLLAMWKLQFLVDCLVIGGLFWIARRSFGVWCAVLAATLYSFFFFLYRTPFLPSQTPFYYFWSLPVSVVSLGFWCGVVRRSRQVGCATRRLGPRFFLYGLFIGFFSLVRSTHLLLLPYVGLLCLPLLPKERRKAFLLACAIGVAGQATMVVPYVLYNHAQIGTYKISLRYKWHSILLGVGFYKNAHQIYFNDSVAVEIANNKYGLQIANHITPKTLAQFEQYERAMQQEVLAIAAKEPMLFVRNAANNLWVGALLEPLRVAEKAYDQRVRPHSYLYDFNVHKLQSRWHSVVFLTLLVWTLWSCYATDRGRFREIVLCIVIGSYFLVTGGLLIPPFAIYIYGYYPIFYLLAAIGFVGFVKQPVAMLARKIRSAHGAWA